jgi:hypothetical protein
MLQNALLLILADLILIGHVLFVCFVVLGLVAVYIGWLLSWCWVRNRLFRMLHLCAIAIVVLQSWFGLICPLTSWEMALRAEAGSSTYSGSFIQHWLQAILYYSAPDWVFVMVYTVFAGLVAASWVIVRPTPGK